MPYLEAVLVGGWQSGGGEETTRMAGCAAWLEEDSERAWACRPTDAQSFSLACFPQQR